MLLSQHNLTISNTPNESIRSVLSEQAISTSSSSLEDSFEMVSGQDATWARIVTSAKPWTPGSLTGCALDDQIEKLRAPISSSDAGELDGRVRSFLNVKYSMRPENACQFTMSIKSEEESKSLEMTFGEDVLLTYPLRKNSTEWSKAREAVSLQNTIAALSEGGAEFDEKKVRFEVSPEFDECDRTFPRNYCPEANNLAKCMAMIRFIDPANTDSNLHIRDEGGYELWVNNKKVADSTDFLRPSDRMALTSAWTKHLGSSALSRLAPSPDSVTIDRALQGTCTYLADYLEGKDEMDIALCFQPLHDVKVGDTTLASLLASKPEIRSILYPTDSSARTHPGPQEHFVNASLA